MAWITVQDSIIGQKLRTLSNDLDCSQNEVLGLIIRLWIWGVENTNSIGKVKGATEDELLYAIGTGLSKSLHVDDVLSALIENNWVRIKDGDIYLCDWKKWQKELLTYLAYKEKNRERVRKCRASAKESKPAVVEKVEEVVKRPVKTISTTKPTDKYDDLSFNDFWDAYPRKEGKGEAYKKYKARLKDGWSPDELLIAAKNYRDRTVADRTEKKYIKHPKTFLSDTTPFVDYIPKKKEPEKESSGNPFADWG